MRATSHAYGIVAGDENGLVASTTNMTSAFRSPVPHGGSFWANLASAWVGLLRTGVIYTLGPPRLSGRPWRRIEIGATPAWRACERETSFRPVCHSERH